jgi:DNA uptake protein ComE-like DNA-binding protein
MYAIGSHRNVFFTALTCVLLAASFSLKAQQPDTTAVNQTEFITDQIENIASGTDLNLDYSDLVDEYKYYQNHPININDNEQVDELERLKLLNDVQINNIKRYRLWNGDIMSKYELQYVDGFNREIIERLLPFVAFGKPHKPETVRLKHVFKYGRHSLLLRYGQTPEQSEGYKTAGDEAVYHPGTAYLGSPQKLYARYAFQYMKKVRFGFTLEKDAGEVWNKNKLPDTVLQLVGNKITNYADFYSAYIYVADMGILKKVVVGDYHLEVGQGLNIWSGLAFGKSAQAIYVKKYGRGIRPNTSVNENRFFRGAAATLQYKSLRFTGFYSHNSIDANIVETDTLDQPVVTTIQETGLHRTINELMDKDAIKLKAYGGHLRFRHKTFEAGVTVFRSLLNRPVEFSGKPYQLFAFSGKQETHYGMDFNWIINKINVFGEFSVTQTGGYAMLAGINAGLNDRFIFNLTYRNYSKDYHNFYAYPFAATQNGNNEEGIYFGFLALLSKNWSLSGYVDLYRFPWLRYYSDFPSFGKDFLFQLNFTPSSRVAIYLKYRYKLKQENFNGDYDYLAQTADITKNNLRFNVSWNLTRSVILKNRLEYVWYKNPFVNPTDKGYLIYQDVLYRPARLPFSLTLRYALFSTSSWNSRIYAYENDVLYAFSVPAYYGNGQRFYIIAKVNAGNRLSFWLRFSRVIWFNKKVIGSGSDRIDGNRKSDVKIQVRLKL